MGTTPATVRKILKEHNIEFNSLRAKPIINKELVLTEEQKEILYGIILGDASIELHSTTARLNITHGGNQESYFDHLCNIFKPILGKANKTPRFDKKLNKYIPRFAVRTLSHQLFKDLHDELYPNNVKTISIEFLNKLTARSLAYWFMDDGSNCGALCTHCFSLEENKLIQKYLKEKWDIETTIQRNYEQYFIYFTKQGKKVFASLVKPYIIESMSYKLKNWTR